MNLLVIKKKNINEDGILSIMKWKWNFQRSTSYGKIKGVLGIEDNEKKYKK